MPYKLETSEGEVHYGKTDEDGKTIQISTIKPEDVKVTWGETLPTNVSRQGNANG
jgi:type VI secretion system secreted protein VgrG